jgi:LuxR family transcriptional regulator
MSVTPRLLDHLEAVMAAGSIEEVWSLHVAAMKGFGLTRLIYGFTRFRSGNSFGDLDDVLVLSNHDQSYLDSFVKSGLFHHAPMVKWAAANVGFCSWRWIEEQAVQGLLTPSEQKVLALNQKFGLTSGYSISFRDMSVRAKGAIGLSGPEGSTQDDLDAIWEMHSREIVLINNVTHLRITAMPMASSRRTLTPRQREALEWVGDGKTTLDIATIMGLTQATVEKHLRLAREALDVDTTAQAVLKASFQNQIFVVPN